jgi:hypothetical protein
VTGILPSWLGLQAIAQRFNSTTERYAHIKDDPLRAVADRTSERIAAIMKSNRAAKVVPLPPSTAGQ